MRNFLIFGIILMFSIFVFACGGEKKETEPATEEMMAASMPEANAEAVWKYMHENMGNFKMWPGTTEKQRGLEPHGALITTRANDIALGSLDKDVYDEGSFIVKVNYMEDGMFGAYTVMYKAMGYDSVNGDWYWAKYKEDGSLDTTPDGMPIEGETVKKMAEMKKGCISCHMAKRSDDWVFTAVPDEESVE